MNRDRHRWEVETRFHSRRVHRGVSVAALGLFLVVSGCGPRNFENENDTLRARVAELEPALAEAEKRAAAAEKALAAEIEKQRAELPPLPEGVLPSLLAGVEFVSYTRGIDTDKDGRDDAARLYVNTYDTRDRFTQVAATAKVTLSATRAGESAVTLTTKEFDCREFDATYRTGFTGTHYTLIVPFQTPPPAGVTEITVSLELTDLLTGATHKTEKLIPVANP